MARLFRVTPSGRVQYYVVAASYEDVLQDFREHSEQNSDRDEQPVSVEIVGRARILMPEMNDGN